MQPKTFPANEADPNILFVVVFGYCCLVIRNSAKLKIAPNFLLCWHTSITLGVIMLMLFSGIVLQRL